MIIELHESLSERIKRDASYESPVAVALDILSQAYREGSHIVFGDISTLEALRTSSQWFGPRTNAVLARVMSRFPQTARFVEDACVKMVVGDFDAARVEEENGNRVIYFPVRSVTTALVQRTLLLVENLTDAVFYEWITEKSESKQVFGDSVLAIEPYPGGGNTTAEAYENIKANTGRLCLCIVDSDRRCPDSSNGETAAKVVKSDKTPHPLTNHQVLPVCSVENLIPMGMFELAWKSDGVLSQRLNQYRGLHVDEFWPYLQLKKEIRCIDLQSKSAFSTFWRHSLPTEAPVENCAQKEACGNRDGCAKVILPALASSPLNAALSMLRPDVQTSFPTIPKISEAWSIISRQIVGWCCGTRPVAAV